MVRLREMGDLSTGGGVISRTRLPKSSGLSVTTLLTEDAGEQLPPAPTVMPFSLDGLDQGTRVNASPSPVSFVRTFRHSSREKLLSQPCGR